MRGINSGGTFSVCVDGDEDFVEEYSMADKGKEWRRPVPLDPESCVREWLAPVFVRPRPPICPVEFEVTLAAGALVQVRQDGGWWRALLQERIDEGIAAAGPSADGVSAPSADMLEQPTAGASDTVATYVVCLYDKADSAVLRVKSGTMRADWAWAASGAESGWRIEFQTLAPTPATADEPGEEPQQPMPVIEETAAARELVREKRLIEKKVYKGDAKFELEGEALDRRLWPGAGAAGWKVVEAYLNAHKVNTWKYVAPTGQVLSSRAKAAEMAGVVLAKEVKADGKQKIEHTGMDHASVAVEIPYTAFLPGRVSSATAARSWARPGVQVGSSGHPRLHFRMRGALALASNPSLAGCPWV